MFIEPKYKNPEDYKKDLNKDLVIPVNSIHDENNFGVDKFLLKPLVKKIINLATAKNIMDNFGLPYMNFLYDVEYSKTGEFTGEGYYGVEDFSIYTTPVSKEEHIAMDAFNSTLNSFQINQRVTTKTISYQKLKIKKLHKVLPKYKAKPTEKSVVRLVIKQKGQTYQYKDLLTENILKHLK